MMKVCVVGAGVSGLTAIKHLLEYDHQVVCFEAGSHIGGLWRYDTTNIEGFGSVMRNTILNTSKEFITFSDLPIDPRLANFPHNREVYKYFKDYADHFHLNEHIEFNTKVIEIKRANDYDSTGNWEVVISNRGGTKMIVFNAVMICIGHHVKPAMPMIPGLHQFPGKIIHSHEYKDHNPYFDRKVLIIGFGNSGGDVSCELARVARQVTVSTRNGTWVNKRVVNRGYPRDVILRTRYYEKVMKFLPTKIKQWLSLYEYNTFFDHEKYGLRPNELPGESPVLLADDLPLHLASGAIRIRRKVERFEGSEVVFEDGTRELVDDVIICTGYNYDFDFIEEGRLIPVHDYQVRLWKRIFVPQESHHTLAVIGLVDPLGPTITMAEMQARVVAHIWANNFTFPSKDQINIEIDEEKLATRTRFRCSLRKSSLQIDHISYFDELASIIGCLPPLDYTLFLRDPQLAFLLHFGPVTAPHYRVKGPHSWPAADKYIKGTFKRVHQGMRPFSEEVPGTPHLILLLNNPTRIILIAVFLLILIIFL